MGVLSDYRRFVVERLSGDLEAVIDQGVLGLWERAQTRHGENMEEALARFDAHEDVERGPLSLRKVNGVLRVERTASSSQNELGQFAELGQKLRVPGPGARQEYRQLTNELFREVRSALVDRLGHLAQSPYHAERNAAYLRLTVWCIVSTVARLWWAGEVTHRFSPSMAARTAREAMCELEQALA